MKLRNILAGIAVAAIASPMITSCESYLDVDQYFMDMQNLDSIFARKSYLYQYLNATSANLPADDYLWTNSDNPFCFTSDEAFCSWNDDRHAGIKFPLEEIDRYSGYFNYWANRYKSIRRANMIIQRINECTDLTDMERRDVIGQCHFLRGYIYYSLVRQYGPVPILPDTIFPSNESPENMAYPRNTYDECINYIVKNLNEASQLLDSERGTIGSFQVATSGAALAIASRILLEAASPWFNGNPYYSDFVRSSDKQHYFPQENDNSKWGRAAAMAKRVIDLNKYSLYVVGRDKNSAPIPDNVPTAKFPDGAGDVDAYSSYADMFTAEESALTIPEIIWARSETNDLSWITFPQAMGGGNGLNVSQQLVDAYRMANGKDINDPESGYPDPDESWKPIGEAKTFSGYQLRPQVAKMYDNREMRFYATISFNHVWREGSSYTGNDTKAKNVELTYYSDGTGMPNIDYPNDLCHSGYSCIKYSHTSDNPKGTYRSKYFPIIRYAEVLLNYVEAMNEMEESYTDDENNITVTRDVDEMVKYFNMIRFRAGLPGITAEDAQDRTTMRELIKRERQVEFALEGRRFYDLRRWGDLTKTLQEPFYGMNTAKKSTQREEFHKRTQQTFKYSLYYITNKNTLFPINQDVMDHNPKLDQNPGW